MRKAGTTLLVIATLAGATLWAALPAVAVSPAAVSQALPSIALPSIEIPTMPPIPTFPMPSEAAPTPCSAEPAPTQVALPGEASEAPISSEAAPSETPIAESPAPCESAAPSEAPVGSGAVADFCSLLTPEEIQGVVGAPVVAASPDTNSCGWVSADPSNSVLILAQDLALSDFDELKSTNVPGLETTQVSGIGDDAYLQTLGGTTTSLYIKKGDRGVQITIVSGTASQDQVGQWEEALGAILVTRI